MKNLDKFTQYIPKITDQNRRYFIGGAIVLVLLLDYFLIMRPQLNTLRALSPKIEKLSKDLKTAKDNIQRVEQFEKSVNENQKEVDRLARKIVGPAEVPAVLEDISRMARDSGVKIDQIMPMKASQRIVLEQKKGSNYLSLPILVNARGGYHDIGRFFSRLESDETFLNIIDLQMTSSGSDAIDHAVRLTVDMIVSEKVEETK